MYQQIGRFLRCSRGNIAFMTAGALVPLLTLTAGGLEFAERQRVETSMQHAADTAVIAAFDVERNRGRDRVRRSHRFFDANFQYWKRVSRVKKRLRGQQGRQRLVMQFEASSKISSLFGEFNPFTSDTIKVTSRAELIYGSDQGPRLISAQSAAGKSQ